MFNHVANSTVTSSSLSLELFRFCINWCKSLLFLFFSLSVFGWGSQTRIHNPVAACAESGRSLGTSSLMNKSNDSGNYAGQTVHNASKSGSAGYLVVLRPIFWGSFAWCSHQAKSVARTARVASPLCSANYRTFHTFLAFHTFQRTKHHHFKLKNKLSTNVTPVEEAPAV